MKRWKIKKFRVTHKTSPSFDNLKATMYRIINKNQPKDINNIKDLPNDSEYYKILGGKVYMFYWSIHILIFMSKIKTEYLYTLKEHIFIDGIL